MPHHAAAMTTTIMALVLVFWLAAHTQQKFFKNVKKVLRRHAIACVLLYSLSNALISIYINMSSMVVKSKKKKAS